MPSPDLVHPSWAEIDEVIGWYAGEVGFHEEKGQNIGTCIKYQKACGGSSGESWCCYFICSGWILTKLRKSFPLIITGSCEELLEDAARKGLVIEIHEEPQYGDLGVVCRKSDDHAHHIFCVTGDPGSEPDSAHDEFPTVEGNTNTDGSSNGTSTCERTRGGRDDPGLHNNYYRYIRLAAETKT